MKTKVDTKKTYEQPAMTVVEIMTQQLMAGSTQTGTSVEVDEWEEG